MDTLRLRGLEFVGRHGTEPWERETGRRFRVEVEVTGDLGRAYRTDRLSEAMDYRVIYARVRHVVESESHNLMERVAWRAMTEIFRTFPAERVRVRLAKTEAQIGGLNQAVEVELERTREEWASEQAAVEAAGRGGAEAAP